MPEKTTAFNDRIFEIITTSRSAEHANWLFEKTLEIYKPVARLALKIPFDHKFTNETIGIHKWLPVVEHSAVARAKDNAFITRDLAVKSPYAYEQTTHPLLDIELVESQESHSVLNFLVLPEKTDLNINISAPVEKFIKNGSLLVNFTVNKK